MFDGNSMGGGHCSSGVGSCLASQVDLFDWKEGKCEEAVTRSLNAVQWDPIRLRLPAYPLQT